MLEAILYGLLAGLVLGLTLYGPAFFLLIRVALQFGKVSGIAFSLGVILGDFLIVILSILGLKGIFESDAFSAWFSAIGGVILIGVAVYLFFQRPTYDLEADADPKPNLYRLFQGFLFNIINPLAYIYWIGIIGAIQSEYALSRSELIVFFASLFLSVFVVDLGKIFLSTRLPKLLNARRLHLINQLLSLVIFGFGVRLLWLLVG